ncbi:patatin-like phospholipase family protein [Rhodococcus sp. NPDC079359]|uniref:patatin-like phospholipase family protein n=1 Tax=Rhodococcus sp. NPDC079359 TaxID=3154961 RepID=UPI00344BF909
MAEQALVLGGGGVAGIAWELGFLLGVQDNSPDLARALLGSDLIVGTSAGSTVAAQITSGLSLDELFERQLSTTTDEMNPEIDVEELGATFVRALQNPDLTMIDRVRAIGSLAIDARTVDASVRRAVIAARLPAHEWPERQLKITALDAESGELTVFDRSGSVGLVDAVAASCAVPGVWPVVSVDGRRFMDGGVASSTNIQVARAHRHVVVLAPTADPGNFLLGGTVADEAAAATDSSVYTVFADDASVSAYGPNPLDPASRAPSAQAGRVQGAREAAALGAFLHEAL